MREFIGQGATGRHTGGTITGKWRYSTVETAGGRSVRHVAQIKRGGNINE